MILGSFLLLLWILLFVVQIARMKLPSMLSNPRFTPVEPSVVEDEHEFLHTQQALERLGFKRIGLWSGETQPDLEDEETVSLIGGFRAPDCRSEASILLTRIVIDRENLKSAASTNTCVMRSLDAEGRVCVTTNCTSVSPYSCPPTVLVRKLAGSVPDLFVAHQEHLSEVGFEPVKLEGDFIEHELHHTRLQHDYWVESGLMRIEGDQIEIHGTLRLKTSILVRQVLNPLALAQTRTLFAALFLAGLMLAGAGGAWAITTLAPPALMWMSMMGLATLLAGCSGWLLEGSPLAWGYVLLPVAIIHDLNMGGLDLTFGPWLGGLIAWLVVTGVLTNRRATQEHEQFEATAKRLQESGEDASPPADSGQDPSSTV